MIENVNFVFHCAATIKFNEPLEFATKINVQGTENVLALAKEMKNLKVTNIIIWTTDICLFLLLHLLALVLIFGLCRFITYY